MSRVATQELAGWSGYPRRACNILLPDHTDDLAVLAGPIIWRGEGTSYGDAAMQPHGTVETSFLSRSITLDEISGLLTAKANVTLAEILAAGVPKGWLLPVLPGTPDVSLGGAIACNIHGKNAAWAGEFAAHVTQIGLRLASGERLNCKPGDEVFDATTGGMGMTGLIEEATIQLQPIVSADMEVTRTRTNTLEEMLIGLKNAAQQKQYAVGWIDHFRMVSKGVLECASHCKEADGTPARYTQPKPRFTVPFTAPDWLLTDRWMRLYNCQRRLRSGSGTFRRSMNGFLFPLHALGHWNRLYGKRGFIQYQCILPDTAATSSQLLQLLQHLQALRYYAYLAVVKYHAEGTGHLSFGQKGFSLALDLAMHPGLLPHLTTLDEWVAGWGGRVYLAKDARMDAQHFRRMYPRFGEWKTIVEQLDPTKKLGSLMAERLAWRT